MKCASVDQRLNRRKEVSAAADAQELWSIVDHWPLYVGVAATANTHEPPLVMRKQP